ncbi:MAG: caspase family protein [Pseudooceanicola sp.]|nr:caspase family protein [Pseudooceanicola sp.]
MLLFALPLDARADRVALVIGNAAYANVGRLDNPENDSRLVAAALAEQGFTVFRRDNLDRGAFFDTLRQFRQEADKAEIALVYYAGHGIEIDGQNYLMPTDAVLEEERDATLEMITVDVVLRQISGARVMKMVVLDACRNNPFLARMKREGAARGSARAGLGRIETSDADTLIAYAAAAGEITPDGQAGDNSPFTAAFVQAMAGPPTDVRRLLGTVRDALRQTVPGAAPFVYSSLGGSEYVINPMSPEPRATGAEPAVQPRPAPVAAPELATTPAQLTDTIMTDFLEADRLATLAAWNAFLVKYRPLNYHLLYARALENHEALAAGRQPLAAPAPQPTADPAVAAAALLPQETGGAARMLQELLRLRNCYTGRIDGDLGPGSQRGIATLAKVSGKAIVAGRGSEIAALHRAILTIRDLPATVSCPAVQSVQRAAPAAKPVKRRADVVAPTPVEPAPAPVRRRARDGYPACPKC